MYIITSNGAQYAYMVAVLPSFFRDFPCIGCSGRSFDTTAMEIFKGQIGGEDREERD